MNSFKMIDLKGLKLLYLEEIIKISILFFAMQFIFTYLNINVYVSCIYCPLIYLYKRNVNHHLLQKGDYILIYKQIFFYLLIVIASIFATYEVILWLCLIYFLAYAVLINAELNKESVLMVYFSNAKHLISLFIYFIIIAIIVTSLRLFELYFGKIFGISKHLIVLTTLIINILLSIVSLISLQKEKQIEKVETNIDITSELGLQILDFFENSNQYLKPNFKITDLAFNLGVKKEAVSTVINHEMKTSFYNLVAKYRIDYAKKILLTQDNYTIESIVEESGFHSRTTFNKYFQKFVGLKPSEFRKANSQNIDKE